MPVSTTPLLKHGQRTITAVADYVTLLEFGCDPNTEVYVRDIIIEQDTVACVTLINVSINGKLYIKDASWLTLAGGFAFGGELTLSERSKAMVIQAKITTAGTLNICAFVTGIEVRKYL